MSEESDDIKKSEVESVSVSPDVSQEDESEDDALFSLDDIDELLGDEDEADSTKEDLATLEETKQEDSQVEEVVEEKTPSKLKDRLHILLPLWEKIAKPIRLILRPMGILLKPFQKIAGKLSFQFGKLFANSWKRARELLVRAKTSAPIFLKYLKGKVVQLKDKILSLIVTFRSLSLKKKFFVVSLVGIGFVFLYLSRATFKGHRWVPFITKPIVQSMADVSDSVRKYDPESETEYLQRAFRQPYFTYLLKGLRVNLKPSLGSTELPMAFVEIYLTLDSTETAIEVKDRQIEIQDYVARVLEESTYDELISNYGKKKIKIDIKTKINQILNHGLVREVLIKNIVYKR